MLSSTTIAQSLWVRPLHWSVTISTRSSNH